MADETPVEEPVRHNASASFLTEITGNPVVVMLNSGLKYRGTLQSVDGFLNIALEETKEYVNNKVTNEYGDVFIRGNNGE